MDPRFIISREEFHNVQTDLKQLQYVQSNHADRLLRLERRQADDAALKSVWNSPFPSALGGTPQHGPLQIAPNDDFDDLDEHGQSLLGSLHLEADDEPIRRGAASRANSVRFDESALHGPSWSGQGGRPSGDFGPVRPGSGLGGHTLMERSLSHKSDGRHSSAGQSIHSAHSGISGRTSSIGLDANFVLGVRDDDSALDIPEPPPGLFYLGSVPSIIRCWLTTTFSSSTLLYAVVCTGSQTSTIDISLVEELGLADDIRKDADGIRRIRLPVYLAEARVTQSNSRSPSPSPQLPTIHASFEITAVELNGSPDVKRGIRIFIGSDTLRLHSADILFSQNLMTLYGNDRDKLSVPFVRPENDSVFRYLATTHVVTGKPKLNANAPEFISSTENLVKSETLSSRPQSPGPDHGDHKPRLESAATTQEQPNGMSALSESGAETRSRTKETLAKEPSEKDSAEPTMNGSGSGYHKPSHAAIWGPWRQGSSGSGENHRESGPLSGYQPAGRSSRSMKVLKPSKSGGALSTSSRAGATSESTSSPRASGEYRRKSQTGGSVVGAAGENESGAGSGITRGDSKRSVSVAGGGGSSSSNSASWGVTGKVQIQTLGQNLDSGKGSTGSQRSTTNPLGNASAFASWMVGKQQQKSATANE
ncbi:hypothetical protein VTK73DRAFT_3001 [Phialemonium thermophilum]|uniref:Ubiquitin carboxyl-terminal hydrolase 19 n=1 Tax=Phialemonium thermophilum TaxID=223376 RepID=A0ABR3Y2P3_9PEZI